MTKKVRIRSILIGGGLTLLFFALIFKCYQIQIVEAAWLMEKAEKVWKTDKVLPAARGTIYDKQNKIMAEDAPAYTVSVNPLLIHERKIEADVVDRLSSILGMTTSDKKSKLYDLVTKKSDKGTFYQNVEIRNEGWKIDSETAEQIREIRDRDKLVGIYLTEEKKRYYPTNYLGSHLIGYNNKEGEPILGLELQYDDMLQGTPGLVKYEKDRMGYELPDAEVTYQPAVNGKSIKLTIDQNIQHYMEQAMQKAFDKYKPQSMTAIAVNPQTMEVLALANMPNFNPNSYWNFDSLSDFQNHAISWQYEPGSTFKIITLAGAVEEGIFQEDNTFMSGSINAGGRRISDHNWGMGWGQISYLEGVKLSSNVAFVKLGYEGLGGDKLREYIEKFGFGQKTGIDLPGEVGGTVDFKYDSEIATATFGQGKLLVTTIQQVAAVAAIANGGKLMRPYIVKEIIDTDTNEVIEKIEPLVIEQVVSAKTSKKVSELLEQVISDREIGTGRKAYIDGYRIAGKTGTAQKVLNGKYSDDKYVVSFIGYAPVENPQILVAVIADEPNLNGDYRNGGDVATPVFREIMLQSLRYLGISSDNHKEVKLSAKEDGIIVPDLSNLTVTVATNELSKRSLTFEIMGGGPKVLAQFPKAGTEIGAEQRIYVLTEATGQMKIPDVTGKSLRDVMETCSLLKITCQSSGEGYATSQSLSGNGKDRVLSIIFEPLSQMTGDQPNIIEQDEPESETNEEAE